MDVQMDRLRDLLSIRKMDLKLNTYMREQCRGTKGDGK